VAIKAFRILLAKSLGGAKSVRKQPTLKVFFPTKFIDSMEMGDDVG